MLSYPAPLPAAEQAALCLRAQNGDIAARNKLVETSLRLVMHRVEAFARDRDDKADLVSEGAFGLIRAVEKFDPTFGASFATYARAWIDNAVRLALLAAREVKRGDATRMKLLRAYNAAVASGLGSDAAFARVAVDAGVKERTVREVVDVLRRGSPMSLDVPLHEDGDATLLDRIESEAETADAGIAARELRDATRAVVDRFRDSLGERERVILDRRLIADEEDALTLNEIGALFGVSRERIRQLEAVVNKDLRTLIRASAALREAFGLSSTGTKYMRAWRERHKKRKLCSACGEMPKAGARMCRKHLAMYRASGLKSRRKRGIEPKRSVMLTHNGETLSISAWSRRVGLSISIIAYRLKVGWSTERALLERPTHARRKTHCLRGHVIAVVSRTPSGGCSACLRENYLKKRSMLSPRNTVSGTHA